MKKIFLYLSIVAWIVALSQSTSAYIDPGTGGVLFNTVWPFIVALFSAVIAFFVKWFWKPIKKLFVKFKGITTKEK